MALINNFSDIDKIIQEINPEYHNKILLEIDTILQKYIGFKKQTTSPIPPPPPPGVPKPTSILSNNNALNKLKSSAFKPELGLKPPPNNLPVNEKPAFNPFKTRGVNKGTPLKLNMSFGGKSTSKPNSKKFLTVLSSMSHFFPLISEHGQSMLRDINTSREIYTLLKNVNNDSSLKDIYDMEFNNMPPGNFLRQVKFISGEQAIKLKKSKLPTDTINKIRLGDFLISIGLLNDEQLVNALKIQRSGKLPEKNNPINSNDEYDVKNVFQNIGSQLNSPTENKSGPKKKFLLGDTLIHLGIIDDNQLKETLGLQRWYNHLLEQRTV